MDARLWLLELLHGSEPLTPADQKREADRKGLEVLPLIDFGVFMTAEDSYRTQSTTVADHTLHGVRCMAARVLAPDSSVRTLNTPFAVSTL
jgi:hypothetical protein